MAKMNESLFVKVKPELKQKVEVFAENNGITQSGAVRMILSEKLREVDA